MTMTLRPTLSETDCVWLTPGETPSFAAHLVTPRRLYIHHGIHVGEGRVIHYAGPEDELGNAMVREVSMREFSRGQRVGIRGGSPACFAPEEIVRRATSRLGERQYNILRNNCEHFCEWCLRGVSRSGQVETFADRSGLKRLLEGMRSLHTYCARPYGAVKSTHRLEIPLEVNYGNG